jgi:hypothetical protein
MEPFDFSDKVVLRKFTGEAMLVRDPAEKPPPIIGIRVSGGWKFPPKKRAVKPFYSKHGSMSGKKTARDLKPRQ